ncbi:ran-binding protein 3-like isoform X2 [Pezoporus wallicus]|uniref:ran-binding protein 3-like isoform X2 n=1 Tax=Pezoporus wallicus TaxID=35540 RepID=UPI00254FD928|nr:ran-binding protein 3-like isoform X2 [Pezoporus wallicus]
MRNQPIPACEGNAVRRDLRHACAGCDFPVESRHGTKADPDVSKRRDLPGNPWAVHQAARLQGQPGPRLCPGELEPKDECCTERLVVAQPTFVFERKDRPLKRPAEDPVCKAENDPPCTQKRGRSCSFTILHTFPPSQPVKKNNIFMTSALLQRNTDLISSTKQGSLSQSQLQNVIRPAILQPPQALTCPGSPVVSLVTEKEALIKVSEDSSYSSAENSVSSKTAAGSSITVSLSSSTTTPIQLFEDRNVQNISNSDFVFGENMVERILSPEKHPKVYNKASSYKGEVTSTHTEPCHISPQTKTSLLKNATLIESAAACISKPVEKILLAKIEVITGEEAEHNVLQINCKLFKFNKLSLTWIERGRGSLRLNDTSSNKHGMLQSRLIMRNQGSLKLILNTRLWEQMVIKRANRKSLCFTATAQEDHSVQVFLIQASSKDIGYLYAAIHHRLVALRSFAEQELDAYQIDTESEIAFQPFSSDDEDDEKITQVSSTGSELSTDSSFHAAEFQACFPKEMRFKPLCTSSTSEWVRPTSSPLFSFGKLRLGGRKLT